MNLIYSNLISFKGFFVKCRSIIKMELIEMVIHNMMVTVIDWNDKYRMLVKMMTFFWP